MRHFMYVPFTGLGLYGGFRGNRWLRNRIKVFKAFTVPSLKAQENQDFTIWVSWRREERTNKQVIELKQYLDDMFGAERVVFTYHGCCFWDDKYDDETANTRLLKALHGSLTDLVNYVGDVDDVIMTIQPSDDCYRRDYTDTVQTLFTENPNVNLVTAEKGYIMNYQTLQLKEYTPKTNPPFFSIRFKKKDFIEPFRHAKWTGPYKSHEYVIDYLSYRKLTGNVFLVGTHGENISTHFDHPYGSAYFGGHDQTLADFGLADAEPLKIRYSIRKQIMRKLPHGWRRKLRYYVGERFANKIYNFLRN